MAGLTTPAIAAVQARHVVAVLKPQRLFTALKQLVYPRDVWRAQLASCFRSLC